MIILLSLNLFFIDFFYKSKYDYDFELRGMPTSIIINWDVMEIEGLILYDSIMNFNIC